ncbi:MAG: sugar-binding transcriptional regulator [Eubacteriales bacterium]|nr:sugar-binding transcriptional regulator [Eubacteriales bacterium]
MKKIVNNERMMLRVCDLYYNRDVSQSDIAKLLDISRPTVSRLLKSAKQKRVVEIIISDPQKRRYSELERRLEKTFKLQEVIVADTVDDSNQKDVLAKMAAGYLNSILKDNDVIGVGMGTTLRYIAPYASKQFQNLTFVPLLGGSGNMEVTLDANYVVDVLAKSFCGNGLHLYVPAVVSRAQTKRTLLKEESVCKVMNCYDRLSAVLVGIGTGDDRSSAFQSGYYSEEMKKHVREAEVCGDICMHLYGRDGNAERIEYNKQVFGINLNKLKKVPYAIGIASGIHKAEAIRGAIRGGYINVLVTDAKCAEALFQLEENEASTGNR